MFNLKSSKLSNSASKLTGVFGCGLLALALSGCREPSQVANHYEPNFLFAKATEIGQSKDEGELDQSFSDTKDLLVDWFGTLDEPKLPEVLKEGDYEDLISLENIKLAVGTPSAPGIYVQQ